MGGGEADQIIWTAHGRGSREGWGRVQLRAPRARGDLAEPSAPIRKERQAGNPGGAMGFPVVDMGIVG